MHKINIKNSPYQRKKKKSFKQKIINFLKKELGNIPVTLNIDFNGTLKASRKTYYQGLLDLYNLTDHTCNISLNYFIEFDNLNDSRDCLWGIFHELIHVKQIYTKQLIINSNGKEVIWQGNHFSKLDFRYSKFNELLSKDRKLATQYHMKTIPWEVEPYTISDLYTGISSF